MHRRLAFLVTGAALAGGLLGCAQQPSSDRSGVEAGCEAPYVHAERTEVRPGESLSVTGTAFWDTCNDTGKFGSPMPAEVPLRQIEVQWRQGEDVVVLGSVDAEPDGSFELPVTVPVTAVSGDANLTATFGSAIFDDEYVAEGDVVEVLVE